MKDGGGDPSVGLKLVFDPGCVCRFGIEMVPLEQEDQSQEEEDDVPVLEGFRWDSLMDVSALSPSRKRSLSESSLSPPGPRSLLAPRTSQQVALKEEAACSQQRRRRGSASSEKAALPAEREEEPPASAASLDGCDSVLGDSSSGTELCDGQGTGKRRRAARVSHGNRGKRAALTFFFLNVLFVFVVLQDAPSAEISGLEHNSKRRKVRSKKGWFWTASHTRVRRWTGGS